MVLAKVKKTEFWLKPEKSHAWVRPNILGCVCISSIVFFICRLSLVLYSGGVKSVQVVCPSWVWGYELCMSEMNTVLNWRCVIVFLKVMNLVMVLCMLVCMSLLMYTHNVKCLAHIKCYSACWWLLLVEDCCNDTVYAT